MMWLTGGRERLPKMYPAVGLPFCTRTYIHTYTLHAQACAEGQFGLQVILNSRVHNFSRSLHFFHFCLFIFYFSFHCLSRSFLLNPISYFPYLFPPFSALIPHFPCNWQHFITIGLSLKDKESCWLNWNWGNIPEHLLVELPTLTCCFHIFSYFLPSSAPPLSLSLCLGTPPRLSCLFIYACAGVCLLCEYVMRPRVMEGAGKGNLRWHWMCREKEKGGEGAEGERGEGASICLCQQNVFSCQHS